MVALGLIGGVFFVIQPKALAAVDDRPFKTLKTLYTAEYDINFPTGMASLPKNGGLLVWDAMAAQTGAKLIGKYGQLIEVVKMPQGAETSLVATFDSDSNNFVGYKDDQIQIFDPTSENPDVMQFSSEESQAINLSHLGIINPAGITLDSVNKTLFLLDSDQPRIIQVDIAGLDQPFKDIKLSGLIFNGVKRLSLRGLAFNPQTKSFFISDAGTQVIYEFSLAGDLLSKIKLDVPALTNIQSMLFAPSADQTDDPGEQNLFILDGGDPQVPVDQQVSGRIVEITLNPTALPPGTQIQPSYLIRTFLTNKAVWGSNSPDPSGIDFLPLTGELIISDSEVDEMDCYTGANVFVASTLGVLSEVHTTLPWSTEPAGVAVNTANQHLFFANDDASRINELNPGPDHLLWTADDTVSSKGVSTDAEDVAYGNNTIFVAGGGDNEFLVIDLGPDGIISPDDGPINAYDTGAEGFSDVEGITYNEETGTLFLISTTATENYLGEFSLTGDLLNAWSLDFMGTAPNIRSGLTFAPSSQDPSTNNIYIVSRGIDNDYGVDPDPNEDDGKVWEISLVEPTTSTSTLTSTPSETATPTSTNTVTATPTKTATSTSTNTATATATATNTATATATQTATSTATHTATATATSTLTKTATPTHTATNPPPNYFVFLPLILK